MILFFHLQAALKAYQKDLNIQTPSSKSETTEESTTKTEENETCSKGETTAGMCVVLFLRKKRTLILANFN